MHVRGVAHLVVAADRAGRNDLVARLSTDDDVRAVASCRDGTRSGPGLLREVDLVWCRIPVDEREALALVRWIVDSGFDGQLVLAMREGGRLPAEAIRLLHRGRVPVLAAVDWPPTEPERRLVRQRLEGLEGVGGVPQPRASREARSIIVDRDD